MEKLSRLSSSRSIREDSWFSLSRLYGKAHQNDELSYDDLAHIDKHRVRISSRCEEPSHRMTFRLEGTVIGEIIFDIVFWLTLVTYVVFRYLTMTMTITDSLINGKFSSASFYLVFFAGFLLSFLLFYVSRNHYRYFDFLEDTMFLMGRVNDVAMLTKATLPIERARRIVRYLNASHVTTYTGLKASYNKKNFYDPLVKKYALLSKSENQRISCEMNVEQDGLGPTFELLTWAMMDIRAAQKEGHLDSNEALQMRTLVLKHRSKIARIFVLRGVPVPYVFIHCMNMLTAVYLPIFAIVIAVETGGGNIKWIQELVNAMVMLLQTMFIIGLRIVGQQLSDPYGNDLIDLQILRYVKGILVSSNAILSAENLTPPSLEEETSLMRKSEATREDILDVLVEIMENKEMTNDQSGSTRLSDEDFIKFQNLCQNLDDFARPLEPTHKAPQIRPGLLYRQSV